jgi:hypothetical protein
VTHTSGIVQPGYPRRRALRAAAGGGLDYNLNNRIAIKPIQVEYVMTQIDSANGFGSDQNDVRYSDNVVFRIRGTVANQPPGM